MIHNYRRRGARGERRGRAAVIAAALVLLVGMTPATAGCGSSSAPAPSASASSVADAYTAAHPTGELPASQQTVDLSRFKIGRRVAAIAGTGVRIVLPARLPAGFKLAAPYIAVGDGAARPNPEGWGRSYRVSYTDGLGLLVMTVGAEDLLHGVVWSGERVRIDGRPARVGRIEDALVVATADGRPRIVITGRRVARASLVDSARSVTVLR
jgi:hypothetical protein